MKKHTGIISRNGAYRKEVYDILEEVLGVYIPEEKRIAIKKVLVRYVKDEVILFSKKNEKEQKEFITEE